MADRKVSTDGKFWVCGCASANGEHINEAVYSGCVYCGEHKHACAEIIVPSGLGGVFQVQLLEMLEEGCRVQVINSANGFDAMAPFIVPFEKIERRTRKAVRA